MATAALLPPIRPGILRGTPDVTRLPSLNEIFPDIGQPLDMGTSATSQDYFSGAGGFKVISGLPSIATSLLIPSCSRKIVHTSSQNPASLSPSFQEHPSPLLGGSTQLLPPMQVGDHQRSVLNDYDDRHSQSFTSLQVPWLTDFRTCAENSSHSGPQSFYYGRMVPWDCPSQMASHLQPLLDAHFGQVLPNNPPVSAMSFSDGMSDYGNGKKPGHSRTNLPKPATIILTKWFQNHVAHPYPTEEEKQILEHLTGLTTTQIKNWFINARRRRRHT